MIPAVLALNIPSVVEYEAEPTEMIEIPTYATNSLPTPQILPNLPIKSDNPFESCVRTAKLTYPEIPLIDAWAYPLNGTLENSEIVILKYENNGQYIFHIAPIATTTETEIILGREGNFVAGEETNGRVIQKDAKELVGYFNYDLWLEIKKLSPQLQAILEDESDFNHYNAEGGVLKGDGNKSYGIAQFQRKTWNWFNKLRAEQGLPKLYEISDPFQQIEMLKWAESNSLLSHWTCYRFKTCLP